jgi:hypothetical protein
MVNPLPGQKDRTEKYRGKAGFVEKDSAGVLLVELDKIGSISRQFG